MSLPADIHRNKEWEKFKNKQRSRFLSHSMSLDSTGSQFDVTDEDIKELKACFDLGFGFDLSNELDPKLTQAFPALELYAAVNRQLDNRDLSRSSSVDSLDSSVHSNASSSFIVDIVKVSFGCFCALFVFVEKIRDDDRLLNLKRIVPLGWVAYMLEEAK